MDGFLCGICCIPGQSAGCWSQKLCQGHSKSKCVSNTMEGPGRTTTASKIRHRESEVRGGGQKGEGARKLTASFGCFPRCDALLQQDDPFLTIVLTLCKHAQRPACKDQLQPYTNAHTGVCVCVCACVCVGKRFCSPQNGMTTNQPEKSGGV